MLFFERNLLGWGLIEMLMGSFSEEELITFTRLVKKLRGQALSWLGLDGDGREGKADSV